MGLIARILGRKSIDDDLPDHFAVRDRETGFPIGIFSERSPGYRPLFAAIPVDERMMLRNEYGFALELAYCRDDKGRI
jgi:hypothetical protein